MEFSIMIALIDNATNEIVVIVESIDGYDMTGLREEPGPSDLNTQMWDSTTSGWVTKPPTSFEETKGAWNANSDWVLLKNASPTQINNWVDTNINALDLETINNLKRVTKLTLLAIQTLAKSRT